MAEEQKTALNFNEIKHLSPPDYSSMDISELEKLAERGDMEAVRELVRRYSPSSTFIANPAANPKEALRWVLTLVGNGDRQGRHWLADCYFSGQYVDNADSNKAIGLLEKNAEEGDYLAYVRLAYYYAHGKGVEQSFCTAIEWLKKMRAYEDTVPNLDPHYEFSIRRGILPSRCFCPEFTYCYEEPRYKLAQLYLQGGFGIEQDFGKAVDWLEKAIDCPNIPIEEKCRAQFTLGKCYLTGGPGLEISYSKAIKCLEKIPEPSISLRYQARRGEGYHVSEEEKHRRQARRQLGICHALGKGVEQDFAEAKKYFEKAARTSSLNTCDIPPMVDPRTEAELGVCLYRLGKIDDATKCFKRSAEKDDILGSLWLTYRKHVDNDKKLSECNYVPRFFSSRRDGDPFHHPTEDEKLSREIDKIESEIDKSLRVVAVCCEQIVREGGCLDLDMLDESKPNVVIEFLQNRPHGATTNPAQIILAFYYKSIGNESQFLSCLEKASYDCNDIIANYVLAKWYERQDREKAIFFLKKIGTKKNNDSSGYSSQGSYVNSSELALKDIELEIANEELKSKNTELELARQKLTELVISTSHTAGNLLRPNTQAKIAKRLKDINLQEDANKLYYAASDIKYVKLQFKLLEIMQTLTGSQSVIDQIQLDRVEKDDDRAMNIDDILNMAAFRVIDKVFDQYEYSLDFARETLRKTVKDFEDLSDSYQDLVLKTDEKPSVIRWCSEHLRSIRINYECDTWKELYFHENSQTVALFFCYFFELFFNAFKYADHNTADFLTVTLGMETIDNQDFLTMHWQNPVGTQKSFGSGKGLNLSESYIGLLNDDVHRNLSQEIAGFSGNVFELIVRISKKNMLGE